MSPVAFTFTVLALVIIAGCSGPGPTGSKVAGDGTPSQAANEDGKGGIVGVVVDETIRPLPNVTIVLEGASNRTAAEDGSFAFLGLAPGAYVLRAERPGYESNQTSVDVAAGGIHEVRLVMIQVAVPDPYNLTVKFTGFAQLTYPGPYGGAAAFLLDGFQGLQPCDRCDFRLAHEGQLRGLIVEALMAPNGQGTNGFSLSLETDGTFRDAVLDQPNPLRALWSWDEPRPAAEFDMTFYLHSDPLPETNKQFEVFATLFYEQPPPDGFSATGGG